MVRNILWNVAMSCFAARNLWVRKVCLFVCYQANSFYPFYHKHTRARMRFSLASENMRNLIWPKAGTEVEAAGPLGCACIRVAREKTLSLTCQLVTYEYCARRRQNLLKSFWRKWRACLLPHQSQWLNFLRSEQTFLRHTRSILIPVVMSLIFNARIDTFTLVCTRIHDRQYVVSLQWYLSAYVRIIDRLSRVPPLSLARACALCSISAS